MQKIFKKSRIATGVFLMAGLLASGVHAAGDMECSNGVCSGKARIWIPELGEVDPSKYTEAEIRQMLEDYWTPERMRNAVGVMPTVPVCDGSNAEFCIDVTPPYDKEAFWTPERIEQGTVVEFIMPNGVGRRALLANELIYGEEHVPPGTPENVKAERDFWTPERLRKAIPTTGVPKDVVLPEDATKPPTFFPGAEALVQ